MTALWNAAAISCFSFSILLMGADFILISGSIAFAQSSDIPPPKCTSYDDCCVLIEGSCQHTDQCNTTTGDGHESCVEANSKCECELTARKCLCQKE